MMQSSNREVNVLIVFTLNIHYSVHAMDYVTVLFSEYGLWAVTVAAFFQGQFILIAAGFLAGTQFFHPVTVWLCAAGGAWAGHLFWYWLGKTMTFPGIVRRFPRWRDAVMRTDNIIQGKPWTSIFLFQYGFGVRILGAIAFGATELYFSWFLFAQLLNCLLWAALIETIGYAFGYAIITHASALWNAIFASITILVLAVLFHPVVKNRLDVRNM